MPARGNVEQRPADAKSRVLVVDDNKDAAESLAMILMLKGHEARTANDGFAALNIGTEFQPRAIILDIGMPGLNGYDTARKIRVTAWGERALLIALTGWGQSEDKQRCIEAGFNLHLTKPVEPNDLVRILEENI